MIEERVWWIALNRRLEALRAKEAGIAEECETARRRVMTAREQFEQVKMARCARFNECFEVVANNIDDLYKVSFTERFVVAALQEWI